MLLSWIRRWTHLDSEGLEREDVGRVDAVEVGLHLRDPRPSGCRRDGRRDRRCEQQQGQVGARKHEVGCPVAAEEEQVKADGTFSLLSRSQA